MIQVLIYPWIATMSVSDNAIIPLKERVADLYFDPIRWAARKLRAK